MIERVLLVAWKGSAATSWVSELRSNGFDVLLEDTTGERAWRTAKERGIDLVIIDGGRKPAHGKQTGHALRDTAKTRDIPIIWTNGKTNDEATVRSEVHPDILLPAPTNAAEALAAIRSLIDERQKAEEKERKDKSNGEPESASGRLPAPARILPGRSVTAPDPYSNLFQRPRTDDGSLIPATITVAPPAPRKRKVRAWEPVPQPDQPEPPPPSPAVVRSMGSVQSALNRAQEGGEEPREVPANDEALNSRKEVLKTKARSGSTSAAESSTRPRSSTTARASAAPKTSGDRKPS